MPPEGLNDIAHQFVYGEVGPYLKVAMGGGYPAFFPQDMNDTLWDMVNRNYDV